MGPNMKKTSTALLAAASLLILSQAASAADMTRPVYKAPPPAAPVWSWTGLYIGGHLGGSWADETAFYPALAVSNGLDPSGFIGGGQIGYNWQFHPNWLVGIEGDFSATNADASRITGVTTTAVDHNWYGTLAGRLGYTQGQWMIYGKGGGAWMDADYRTTIGAASSTVGDTRGGWMAGVGIEWMFAPQWSAKVEYNYLDFGSTTYTFPTTGVAANIDTQVNLLKVGINYKLF
jgi:outer membrane immunogenic protein